MKKTISFLLLSAIAFSCHNEQDSQPKKGSLVLSLSNDKIVSGGRVGARIDGTEQPSAVLISIKNAQGNYVEQNKKLTLYNFGPSYTSESIELPEGQYAVTDFQVLDINNKVLYAAPKEGAELASLVKDPLPVSFKVANSNSTLVNIEVLEVGMRDPKKFGYASFGFEIVRSDIALTFIASTNPFMVTRGYDSAIVTFSSSVRTIQKKLSIISPVEARGYINPSELASGLPYPVEWKMEVKAYYESIDEVLYNLHINETITSASLTILPEQTTQIKFESDKVALNNKTETYAKADLSWENWAHLTDNTGYFHLKVKNDICDPLFQYELKKDGIFYLFYEKDVYCDTNPNIYGAVYTSVDKPAKGKYSDNKTFAGMCPSGATETITGTIYFLLETNSGGFHDCYLVWMYKDTPIDPQNPNGPKTKVGGFQLRPK